MAKGNSKKGKSIKGLATSGIEIVSLSNVDQAPVVSERIQRSKEWVFFGDDNLYPNKVIRLADNSALHASIVEIKARMVAGNGFVFSGNQIEEAEKFMKDAIGSDFLHRVSTDLAMFTAFYLNVQYNRGGEIDTITPLDYSFVRSGKMDHVTRKVASYWMSTRWDIATRKHAYSPEDMIYKPIEILAFDPKMFRDKTSKENGQLIVSKKYSPGKLFYSDVSYRGAINWIEIAGQISSFHKAQLENGMTGNVHIHINSDLTDDKKRKQMLQALNDQYTGSKNAGRIFLTYGVGEANKVELTPLSDTGTHQALSSLSDNVNQEIISAHGMPKQLVGVDVKAGLGGLQLREAIEMFQEIQIQPLQNQLTGVINDILKFNDIDAEVKISPLQPATFILDTELMKLTHTVDEARELANSQALVDENGKPDENGSKLLIEVENGSRDTDSTDSGSESKS